RSRRESRRASANGNRKTRSCSRSLLGRSRSLVDDIVAGDELAAQEFPHRRFRQRGDKDITAWALEAGQAGAAAERIEFVGLDRGAALDEGGDDLAPALVRQADHRDLG